MAQSDLISMIDKNGDSWLIDSIESLKLIYQSTGNLIVVNQTYHITWSEWQRLRGRLDLPDFETVESREREAIQRVPGRLVEV